MSQNYYDDFTSEQLKSQLRKLLNEKPLDINRIQGINAKLSVRADQAQTQEA